MAIVRAWTCKTPVKKLFLNIYPQNYICTLSGIHIFVCVPLEHFWIFQSDFVTKTIILPIFENGFDYDY